MDNPIVRSGFFATPKDYEDLADMIKNSGTPEEQRLAWFGASLALNMAHQLIDNFIKDKQNEIV